jgi:enamine deaminase RidA (YjgF/YER057c/UK114 family)
MEIEAKLEAMGLILPPSGGPAAGNYVPGVQTGNLVFLSGVGPRVPDGEKWKGKLGREYTTEQGYEAAKGCALNLLSNLKGIIGDLDRVTHIVKVLGMVNCDPEWVETPLVINGCSDLLVELYGDKGRHGRSAVGMATLPFAIPVEIEMVVEIAPEP